MAFQPISNSVPSALQVSVSVQSPIEGKMMLALMENKKFTIVKDGDSPEGEGFFVMPQKTLGPYRADFIIKAVGYPLGKRVWPPKKKVYIAVECDGAEFHTSPEQKSKDRERDKHFSSKGIKTFRFTGSEIHQNSSLIARDLASHLENEVWKS